MAMISETGLVMIALFGSMVFAFWVGYLAGKNRWQSETVGAVGPDELEGV